MPFLEPKYLNLGCKKAARCAKYGSCPKYRKWGDSWECSFQNQLNAAVAYGSSWSHSKIPMMENLCIQSFMNQYEDSNFPFDCGWWGNVGFLDI